MKYMKPERNHINPLTPEQIKTIIKRALDTEIELPMVLGALYGIRMSEILSLRWADVDLVNNSFDITPAVNYPTLKTGSRSLPITEAARPFFDRQLFLQSTRRVDAAQNGAPYYDTGFVVAKCDGTPQKEDWILSEYARLLSDLELPHSGFYVLRHTAIAHLYTLADDANVVHAIFGLTENKNTPPALMHKSLSAYHNSLHLEGII